jgi:2-dehydro-3-deoxygluconokinase
VTFVTALGEDPFSRDLRVAWVGEGLAEAGLLTGPARNVGLYAISVDDRGERSFAYWRGESAARGMFDLDGMASVLEAAEGADLIVYSLITLAILPPAGREALWAFCRRARARGAKVAFDGNYRPRLWSSVAEAAAARDAALAVCDIGLPTLEDEVSLSGAAAAEDVAARWRAAGVGEVVVKLGARGCLAPHGATISPPLLVTPVDTSGAGDAFNAGYLAARLAGAGLGEASMAGHSLAAWVIGRHGAIPPIDDAAPYGGRNCSSPPSQT